MTSSGKTIFMKLKLSVIILFLIVFNSTNAQEGKNLFDTNCKMCHSIGGGKIVGPDLKGISEIRSLEWFVSFTKDSKALIESGDEQAKAIFEEYLGMPMPPSPLSEVQISSIYNYLATMSKTAEEEVNTAVVESSSGDAEKGELLFYGKLGFETGGVSCVACHTTGAMHGGTLAKDLTQSAAAVKPIMEALPFPAMKISYENNKLTISEIDDLTAYIALTSKSTEEPRPCLGLPIGGFLGMILFLVFLTLYWHKRKKESVNKGIYDRQL